MSSIMWKRLHHWSGSFEVLMQIYVNAFIFILQLWACVKTKACFIELLTKCSFPPENKPTSPWHLKLRCISAPSNQLWTSYSTMQPWAHWLTTPIYPQPPWNTRTTQTASIWTQPKSSFYSRNLWKQQSALSVCSVEKSSTTWVVWKSTLGDTLVKSLSVALCAGSVLLKRHTWNCTSVCILGKSLIAVPAVAKAFHRKALWTSTFEHTLVKNLTAVWTVVNVTLINMV